MTTSDNAVVGGVSVNNPSPETGLVDDNDDPGFAEEAEEEGEEEEGTITESPLEEPEATALLVEETETELEEGVAVALGLLLLPVANNI